MIESKDDYKAYLEADRIALDRSREGFKARALRLVAPDYIWLFQKLLRKAEYLGNVRSQRVMRKLMYPLVRMRLRNIAVKLGFSIPLNVFGPGLAIVHYGTIIVNENAKIGSNCRIHADTNIGASGGSSRAPVIGNNVYIAPGAKIYGDISVPNNCAIGANSVLNRTYLDEDMLIAGMPAKPIKRIDIRQLISHV